VAEYQYVKADVVRRYLRTGQLQGVLLDGAWRLTKSDLGASHRKARPQPRRRERHAANRPGQEYTARVCKDAAAAREAHPDLKRFLPHHATCPQVGMFRVH
jgi:hypothetical protein